MAGPKPFTVYGAFFPVGALCAVVMLLGSPTANAQRRVTVMSAPMQSRQVVRIVPAPQPTHVVTGAPPAHPVNRRRANAQETNRNPFDRRGGRNLVCSNNAGLSVQQLLDPVPSYGFNYQHLNAVDTDLAVKATIDPATEIALSQARRFNCGNAGTGGYILWGGGYGAPEEIEEEPQESGPAAPPQIIVVQVPAAAESASKPAEVQAEEPPPLPDEGQFVLVKRDGTQLQATAFTRSDNTIVYITSDGLRRTVLISDLDTDATVRVNGERGMQVQLSL
jgi:hypothetical protein